MFKIIVLITLQVYGTFGSNILYISSMATHSHHIWNQALVSGLVTNGHNLTYVAPNLVKNASFSQILLDGVYEAISKSFDFNNMATHSTFRKILESVKFTFSLCKIYAKSKGLQVLLNYPSNFKFDLIIIDVTGSACLFPLIQKFGFPPAIGVTAFPLPPHVAQNFGNQLQPAILPWYGLSHGRGMNFLQRFWNVLYTYGDVFLRHPRGHIDRIIREIFGENMPRVKEFQCHISLVLVNTDPILYHPQPLPPNFVALAGVHVKKARTLPSDLQNILDAATSGVILFSLGTNVRSDKLDVNTQRAFLNAFSKIPETVIWKFEGEVKNLPQNVIVRKWLPQSDILGHPNVKLFVGHGGALSTQEAVYNGIPMICIPFILDQLSTTRIIVDRKLGVSLNFRNITSDEVSHKLREVLHNPMYFKNMKKLSQKFRDRPETPLERGLFWVEYVLRHGHAKFLSGPQRETTFFETSGLDMIGLLMILFFVAVAVIIYTFIKIKKFC